jgi:serine/tyrosine/threonine adenylyltransferase
MRMHFPAIPAGDYAAWYREICRRTALLIADWMRLGFVHGVMNTDNMSILGLTIDYGPYGWLEGYELEWTPNTTDAEGRRYAYGNQPQIAHWNLARLAEALMPLIPEEAKLHAGLDLYASTFNTAWRKALPEKLGIREADEALITDGMNLLAAHETDFTLFFRNLARVESAADLGPLRAAFYVERDEKPLAEWVARWLEHKPDGAAMDKVNPRYVFRNYLAQTAIDALEKGDASVMERLQQVLIRPYDEQPENKDLAERRPEWARHKAGCSALSCSS